MEIFLTIVHVIVCIFLIVSILLQAGKLGAGAVFGGGQTVFGPRGAQTFLGKVTAGMAIAFMVTSMSLAYLSSQPDTVLADEIKKAQEAAKALEEEAESGKAAPPDADAPPPDADAPPPDAAAPAPDAAAPAPDAAAPAPADAAPAPADAAPAPADAAPAPAAPAAPAPEAPAPAP